MVGVAGDVAGGSFLAGGEEWGTWRRFRLGGWRCGWAWVAEVASPEARRGEFSRRWRDMGCWLDVESQAF